MQPTYEDNKLNKFVCCVAKDAPFMLLKLNHEEFEGNQRFEGFCVDLLNELAAILKFNYELYLVADGQYGSRSTDGSWNGLMRELTTGVS